MPNSKCAAAPMAQRQYHQKSFIFSFSALRYENSDLRGRDPQRGPSGTTAFSFSLKKALRRIEDAPLQALPMGGPLAGSGPWLPGNGLFMKRGASRQVPPWYKKAREPDNTWYLAIRAPLLSLFYFVNCWTRSVYAGATLAKKHILFARLQRPKPRIFSKSRGQKPSEKTLHPSRTPRPSLLCLVFVFLV